MSQATGHTVSPFGPISKADYPGIFKDFDKDHIPNVDDPHPLQSGDTKTIEEVSLSDEINTLINVRNKYAAVLNDVMDGLRQINPDATVKGRVKSPYSVVNKLIRKRLKANILTAERAGEQYTRGLTDMAGCMIVLKSQEDLNAVVEKISSGKLGTVFEHEDKYKNPIGGYRAHHFIVMHEGIPVEIQVKTQRMKQITDASHTPYKKGVLNQEKMNQLTSLAWKADKGDKEAAKAFAKETTGNLAAKLTVRPNPDSPKLKELREDFRASVKKLALVVALDKFPKGKKEEAFNLFRHHGELLGVDFDGIYQAALEEADSRKKVAKGNIEKEQKLAPKADPAIGRHDLDLGSYEPIKMTTGQRAKANDAALAVLQKENRAITSADIDTLRKYTGNGGLKNKAYKNEDIEGKKRGALNEHYTSYPIIQMIWDKITGMGVNSGNILEPGSGIGNFAGFLPNRETMRMLMVEQSVVSSRIAELMYPQQVVLNEKFQNADLTPYNITGVVGNVPFGSYRVATRKDDLKELNPPIHDYFILKSLNALQPGGWMAVITSISTADKKNRKLRQAMIEQAGLVGAYRLPSTAFKDNADTLVTTDLLIFQKYNGNKNAYSANNELFANSERAVETGRFGKENELYEAYYNAYFKEHPENVLGEHIQGHNAQWPTRMGVKGTINEQTISRVLDDGLQFVTSLPENQSFYDVPDKGVRLDIARDYHPGNIIFHEGKFYEKQRIFYKQKTIGGKGKVGQGLRTRIESACKLLDIYDDFVTALAQNTEQKEPLRGDFKRKLDNHIENYGLPDEDEQIRDIFKYDNRLYKLTTFVKRDPITDELVYADILDSDNLFSDNYTPKLDDSADLSEVAIFGHNIGETLNEDFYLSTWNGGTATAADLEDAFKNHKDFFYNPESEKYEFRYEYLAGDVRLKLEQAENSGLDKNVEALKGVLPEWIDVFKIQSDPRHIFTYLPHKVLQEFITDKLNYRKAEIGLVKDKANLGNRFYMRLRNGRYVKPGNESRADFNLGWGTIPFSKILNRYIQDKRFPFVPFDEDGSVMNITKKSLKKRAEKSGRYKEILDNSNRKQGDFNERMLREVPQVFNNWLRTEAPSKTRDKVEQAYNKTFNSNVNPTFDGSTLRFRGMSDTFYGDADFRVFKHNRAVAEKMVWNGRGANNHDVGAGKTMASIITSQVLLQQGAAQKPMFVVPGKVQEKWVEEYSQLFPDAKILNMKMDKADRHKELTMAQLYNWDAIFIADHSFKQLSLSPAEQAKRFAERVAYFDDLLENFDEAIESEEGMKNSAKKRVAKNLEKQKEEFEAKLENVSHAKRLETDIFFDELGVDALFFDEAHFYKNAISSPKAQKLGIAATNTSQRAEDALQKTRWLFDTIGYRNVFVLTATPVVNSPIEVWHMLNLCAPDLLEKYEIDNLDNFINLYVRTEEKLVKKTTGKYKQEMVVAGYVNLPEMRQIIDEVMDIKSYDQLIQFYKDNPDYYTTDDGIKKPLKPQFKRPNANMEQEVVEPSRVHSLLFDDIVLRANNVMECLKDRQCETRDNFLVITGDGSKIATDLRVYDDDFDGVAEQYLKLGQLVNNVHQGYGQRTNPAPGMVPESIYGSYFSTHRQQIRQNPQRQTYRNQIIFCDWITLEGGRPGSFHELIKEELAKKGIPENEVAIINGNIIGTRKGGGNYLVKSSDDKEELKKQVQDEFNQGKYRVIIGNKSIAEGMNLQKWTTDIHHMDVPYTPSEIQQRNGRGLRQGNQWEKVNIHFYLMQDSFDQYRLELVNKKQSWIDELFFGNERTSKTQNESESLNYEQMVAATNSDPRVKEFFNAKATSGALKGKINTLEEETQRMQSSLAAAEQDLNHKRDTFQGTIDRERKLGESQLPAGADEVLEQGKLEIKWNAYSSDIRRIDNDISNENKQLFASRIDFELDVPQTNANGRVQFFLIPPPEGANRQFYNKIKWSSIKRMAPAALNKAFGWNDSNRVGSGYSVSGTKDGIIADQDDFYNFYDVDIQALRDDDDTYEEIKKAIGMFDLDNWKPIISQKLAELFLILERAWINGASHRIERLQENIEQSEKTMQELEGNLSRTRDELNAARTQREQALETQSRLTDVVNEIVAVEYENRDQLYEEMNRIAPEFGIKGIVHVRDIDADLILDEDDDDVRSNPDGKTKPMYSIGQKIADFGKVKERFWQPADQHNQNPYWQYKVGQSNVFLNNHDKYFAENDLNDIMGDTRENPAADMIYLGISDRLQLDQGARGMVTLQGPQAMLTNKAMNKLFITPLSALKGFDGNVNDQSADEAFETWNSYSADGKNYSLDWPDGEDSQPVGHADEIIYISDKIIQQDDKKGKKHTYRHQFDTGQRPAFKRGNMLIIKNLKINQRGILN